jgi:adenylate kinase
MEGGRGVRAVMLGAPGCGKGTQAERLSAVLGVPAISTGELLRQAVATGTELGSRVAAILASGKLVDDALMADVVRHRLQEADAAGGFLLDGYPRTPSQAETLAGLLCERGQKLDAVVLLEVPEDVLVRRALARRREDDRDEVIRERLRIYHEKTAPLIGHYDAQGLLSRIDGNRPMGEVTEAALAALRRA